MRMRSGLPLVLAGLLCGASSARAAIKDVAASYAVRVPVTPAAGASLQRLDVPPQALAASREAGLADLRIFDAQGRSLPLALSPLPAPRIRHTVRLDALPILGAPDAMTIGGMSLAIEAGRNGVVRVQGVPADTTATTLLGVLLDTRRLVDPVDRLRLEAAIPRGQPIGFTIEASADLRNWERLGETTLYSAAGGAVAGAVGLPTVEFAGRTLRVTWSPAAAGVSVRGASVTTTRAADPAEWPRAIVRPATADAKGIGFELPFATSVAALEVAVAGGDAVIPVRILGRNDREQPWAVIATGSVFRVTAKGVVRRNPPFDLAGTKFRTLRIEADARSAGFTEPPAIAVRFAPARLLFLASDAPPFTLAVGLSGAAPVFLPAASLVPGYGPAAEAGLPAATVPPMPDPIIAAAAEAGGSRRAMLLWGMLLAATALLGAMVWRLMRERAPTGQGGSLVDERPARSEP